LSLGLIMAACAGCAEQPTAKKTTTPVSPPVLEDRPLTEPGEMPEAAPGKEEKEEPTSEVSAPVEKKPEQPAPPKEGAASKPETKKDQPE
jgi:hypothetical protein